jgi:hypothetical protein
VAIDGYVGVFWNEVKQSLEEEFEKLKAFLYAGLKLKIALNPPNGSQEMVTPYIGEPVAVWGTKADLTQLGDFIILMHR